MIAQYTGTRQVTDRYSHVESTLAQFDSGGTFYEAYKSYPMQLQSGDWVELVYSCSGFDVYPILVGPPNPADLEFFK